MTDSSIERHNLRASVLFLVYNRPYETQKVFNEIRRARPTRLYVAADGPRSNREGDEEKVKHVRDLIQQGIDWDCEVTLLFREKNLGSRYGAGKAIGWFFEQEEEGIILEDDCVPEPTFFRYCDELLEHYRSDSRIMMISGNNFQSGHKRTNYSYYYSRYTHIWGWATWRRAWDLYDMDIKVWPELREGEWLSDVLRGEEYAIPFWEKRFQRAIAGENDMWDQQWMLCNWVQHGLSVIPNCNLVTNIGFGPGATHGKWAKQHKANIPTEPMSFPLKHPPYMIRDARADGVTERRVYRHKPLKRLQRNFDPLIRRAILMKQLLTRS